MFADGDSRNYVSPTRSPIRPTAPPSGRFLRRRLSTTDSARVDGSAAVICSRCCRPLLVRGRRSRSLLTALQYVCNCCTTPHRCHCHRHRFCCHSCRYYYCYRRRRAPITSWECGRYELSELSTSTCVHCPSVRTSDLELGAGVTFNALPQCLRWALFYSV